jgi:hypothetical protein
MADTTTMTPTPGAGTSEFTLTKWAIIIGTVLQIIAGALESLQQAGLFHSGTTADHVVAAVLVIVGLVLQVASVFGYQSSRTAVKVGAMQAAAAQTIAQLKSSGLNHTGPGTVSPHATAPAASGANP